jgi:hypothetical protein
MSEMTRVQNNPFAGLGGPGHNLFDDNAAAAGLATVASGPYAEQLPVGNMTVRDVRARFGDRLDIDPTSQAVLDGHDVNEDTIIRNGQVLMFTHRAGEKGV